LNFDAVVAKDGIEALELIRRQHIDIVLTDFKMPGMNGLEFTRKAKEIAPSAQIIVYSGITPDAEQESEIRSEADAFLRKPVNLEKVSEVLARL
jgi:YesN/AraC family two-component response regulator